MKTKVKKQEVIKNLKTTGFGTIELKGFGRRKLEKLIDAANLGSTDKFQPVKITIEAEIVDISNSFDGKGQEFQLSVKKLKQVA